MTRRRNARAATLVELMVAAMMIGILLLVVLELVNQGGRENADSAAFTEIVRAHALLTSVIGGDLDRLVVEPGHRPVAIADGGQSISFYTAREIPDRSYDAVAVDAVAYETRVRADGARNLYRNGSLLGELRLASVRFDQVQIGPSFHVSARVCVLGAPSTWRPGSAPPGAICELVRGYTTPVIRRGLAPALDLKSLLTEPGSPAVR